MKKFRLYLFFFLPILILFIWVLHDEYQLRASKEFVFKISGYDPKHLLSGHYLTYQVEYGQPNPCERHHDQDEIYLCLNKSKDQCLQVIKGICRFNRFLAGIERYYVSESDAVRLEQQIRAGEVKLAIRVAPNGSAMVSHMIVNGEIYH